MKSKKFSDKVYDLCKKIPKGKVSTYKLLAKELNCKAYRAVGNVLNKNKNKDIPCHRVIGSNGYLIGFKNGLRKKSELLKKEGVEVINGKINLRKFIYKF